MSKKEKFIKPLDKGFYAFNSLRAGDFLLFVEQKPHHYDFLYIPGGDFFYLTFDSFDQCMKNGILSLVEVLPKNIFDDTMSFVLSNPPTRVYDLIDEKKQ